MKVSSATARALGLIDGKDRAASARIKAGISASAVAAAEIIAKVKVLTGVVGTTEHPVADGRKWRFDAAWPEHRVAVEIQGGTFMAGAHARGPQIRRDHEKHNAAVLRGWRVLFCQPDTAKLMPVAVAALIEGLA